jgi:putative sigma-54 modulation protein
MNITVQSIHFDADHKLIELIKGRLGKLSLFHDNIISAEVGLKLEHDGGERENKIVEIKLVVPGREVFAKRRGKVFEEAVSTTVEALRSQLIRTKERLRAAS